MRKVPVSALRPEMILSRPIYGADGQLFLNAGVVLKGAYISGLLRLGISSAYVEDPLLGDVVINEVVTEETRQHAVRVLKDVLAESRNERRGKTVVLTPKLRAVAQKLVQEVLDNKGVVINLADIRTTDDYTFYHSVNVCILSLLAGSGMNLGQARLEELGVGALLHDMGKVWVDERILKKKSSLTPDEYEEIKKHPFYGYKILSQQPDISPASNTVVIQHHERCNGSGYPARMTKNEIHTFARLVMVADVYDALVSDRPYRKSFMPHEAIEMISSCGDLYDTDMVRHLLHNLAAYPVGTAVRLSNGDLGIVVENRKGSPLRPKVRVCKDGNGFFYSEPTDVDLLQKLDLVIKDVLDDASREREIPIARLRKK